MDNLAPGNVERQKQVSNRIKDLVIQEFPRTGQVHTRDRWTPNLQKFKDVTNFVDVLNDNTTLCRACFITLKGPEPSDSGTVNRTPPEVVYEVTFVWQFEDERADGSNSTDEFNDLMMHFYEYFERNHNLGFRGLHIQEPELKTAHSLINFFGIECHGVTFIIRCSLYGN